MSKRDGKAYYKAFVMRGGIVTAVLETRKPSPRLLRRGQKIDEDGVYQTWTTSAKSFQSHTDAQRIPMHITIAGAM